MTMPYAAPKHLILDSRPLVNTLMTALSWVLIGIVLSVLALVVLLLFVNSGVPWFLSSLLLAVDLLLIFVHVRRSHMLGYALIAFLGVAIVLT